MKKKFFHKNINNRIVVLKNFLNSADENQTKPPPSSFDKLKEFANKIEINRSIQFKQKMANFLKSRHIVIICGLFIIPVSVLMSKKTFLKQINISSIKKTSKNLCEDLKIEGKILSTGWEKIETTSSGKVEKVYVKRGDKIREGDKITDLVTDEGQKLNEKYLVLKRNLESEKTTLKELQENFNDAHLNFMTKAVSNNLSDSDPIYIEEKIKMDEAEKKFKKQQSLVNSMEAEIIRLRREYEKEVLTIKSPAAGIVENLLLSPEEKISQKIIGVIKTENETILSFSFPQDLLTNLTNDSIEISFEDYSDKTFFAKILNIDQNLIKITIPQNNEPIFISMKPILNLKKCQLPKQQVPDNC